MQTYKVVYLVNDDEENNQNISNSSTLKFDSF